MFESDRITASFDTLHRQTGDTVHDYLRRAKAAIDDIFGDGYAAKHPELVAAYLQAAGRDMATSTSMKVLGSALDRIADSVEQLRPD